MIYKYLYKFFLILFLTFAGDVYAQVLVWPNVGGNVGDDVELQQLGQGDDANVGLHGQDYMDEGGDTVGTDCHTSTLNEITAAFNTQGYWLLDFVVASFKNGLGGWAALLYACVVFGGIAMMAMGQPPRMYLWFILGPLIFNWMLYTSVTDGGDLGVKGVCWYVGNKKISQQRVWELAEAGMVNMPKTGAVSLQGGSAEFEYDIYNGPSGTAQNLPALFLFIDSLVSEPIAWVIEVSGIKSKQKNDAGNLTLLEPGGFSSEATTDEIQNAASWYLLGNTRWEELMDITNASLEGNDDLREALIRFMASECGDVLADNIDDNAYLTAGARRAGGGALPKSVFFDEGQGLEKSFEKEYVPVPTEIREILKENANDKSTLAYFIANDSELGKNFVENIDKNRDITCRDYLYFIVQGFRWSSALQYNMIVKRGTDLGIPATWVTYSFLYGWRFGVNEQPQLGVPAQAQFTMNMIMAYMFRNELSTALKPIDQTYTTSQRAENYLNANVRSVGSMSKAMEFYQWSKLVPYMQGVCLYILSAAYPLACLLMLIPGWHKAFITWIGFYTWAKSWDAGFAIIGSLDNNIWGMLGNGDDAAYINEKLYRLRDYGTMGILEGETAHISENESCDYAFSVNALINCITPYPHSVGGKQSYDNAYKTFDQAVLLANNLQHDIANGYYIYLMSALYFAVPAVTGQLFLGAKAGMASLATQGIGSVAGELGRAAGSGYSGEISNRGTQGMSVSGQEAFAKSMRQDGLALQALGYENESMQEGMRGNEYGLIGSMVDYAGRRLGHDLGAANSAIGAVNDAANKFPGFHFADGGNYAKEQADKIKRATGLRDGAAGFSILASFGMAGVGVVKGNKSGQLAAVGAMYKEKGQKAQALSAYKRGQAGRYQEAAQQRAAEAQWKAQRRLGNQIAGSTAAVGVLAGSFNAGAKPTSMNGMIGLGYMDNNKDQSVGYGLNYGGLSLQGESGYGNFGTSGDISGGDWGKTAQQDATAFNAFPNDYGSDNNRSTWGAGVYGSKVAASSFIPHDLTIADRYSKGDYDGIAQIISASGQPVTPETVALTLQENGVSMPDQGPVNNIVARAFSMREGD